jgi:CheY-like chemotaxis protein
MGVSHFYTRHLNMTKILVIDDEELMRKLMKKMLMRDGHDVFIARDGVDGVEQFHQINPDLVITDMVMPNKDGYEVIKELLATNAKLPIIAMSGGRRLVTDGFDSIEKIGSKGILQKPFTQQQLREMIEIALNT